MMRTPLATMTLLGVALGACPLPACTTFSDAEIGEESGAAGVTSAGGQAGAASQGGAAGVGGAAGQGGEAGQGGASAGASGAAGASVVAVCEPPIAAIDTTGASANVVGTGTAASCDEAALGAAVAKGGVITFDCGGPATIAITSVCTLPTDRDTVIDGGGLITLDGGGVSRLLRFDGPGYRSSTTTVTLQHLTLQNGYAGGTLIPFAEPPCSQGTEDDGGGGAIRVRDGILHVVDVTWLDNRAAPNGPTVGGGAIDIADSRGLVIVASVFAGNMASNGGAVNFSSTDLTVVNSVFWHNQATGSGSHGFDEAKCPTGDHRTGSGGDGGALHAEGQDGPVTLCGSRFEGNLAGSTGGVLRRMAYPAGQLLDVDRCTFHGNRASVDGGALKVGRADPLRLRASTLSSNQAETGGAIVADATRLDVENTTFHGNKALVNLGGALFLTNSPAGVIGSATFALNQAEGGLGKFGAAIASFGSALTLRNSIVDANTTIDCGNGMACQPSDTSTLVGASNLQWPGVHKKCPDAPDLPCTPDGGTSFADPQLGPLADNGGPTLTLLPAATSPALGRATSDCPASDQRGRPRPAGQPCTVGAVEVP